MPGLSTERSPFELAWSFLVVVLICLYIYVWSAWTGFQWVNVVCFDQAADLRSFDRKTSSSSAKRDSYDSQVGQSRFAQSIRDAALAERGESVAEVERKSEFRQGCSQTCSFSYPTISVISRSRPRRVRRILRCHLRGGAGSLFRDRGCGVCSALRSKHTFQKIHGRDNAEP